MDNTKEILQEAFRLLQKRYGTNFKFEEEDEFVFLLNNCILILAKVGKKMQIKFIENEPFVINMTCQVYPDD
jgi:hypothetical protein